MSRIVGYVRHGVVGPTYRSVAQQKNLILGLPPDMHPQVWLEDAQWDAKTPFGCRTAGALYIGKHVQKGDTLICVSPHLMFASTKDMRNSMRILTNLGVKVVFSHPQCDEATLGLAAAKETKAKNSYQPMIGWRYVTNEHGATSLVEDKATRMLAKCLLYLRRSGWTSSAISGLCDLKSISRMVHAAKNKFPHEPLKTKKRAKAILNIKFEKSQHVYCRVYEALGRASMSIKALEEELGINRSNLRLYLTRMQQDRKLIDCANFKYWFRIIGADVSALPQSARGALELVSDPTVRARFQAFSVPSVEAQPRYLRPIVCASVGAVRRLYDSPPPPLPDCAAELPPGCRPWWTPKRAGHDKRGRDERALQRRTYLEFEPPPSEPSGA